MYYEYFGLSEPPFKITPDPRFLWYSDQHKEAKAKIEQMIRTQFSAELQKAESLWRDFCAQE